MAENVKYNKKDISKLIKTYYEKIEKYQEPKVSISTTKECVGYCMGEHDGAVTTIKVTGKKTCGGITVNAESIVTEEGLKSILNELLKSDGYTVESLSIESELTSHSEGYGLDEHSVSRPHFNGVMVCIKNINDIGEKSLRGQH